MGVKGFKGRGCEVACMVATHGCMGARVPRMDAWVQGTGNLIGGGRVLVLSTLHPVSMQRQNAATLLAACSVSSGSMQRQNAAALHAACSASMHKLFRQQFAGLDCASMHAAALGVPASAALMLSGCRGSIATQCRGCLHSVGRMLFF